MKTKVNSRKHQALFILTFFLLFSCIAIDAQTIPGDLSSLTQIKNGVNSKRISSFDRSGGNNDRIEHIKPGETKVIFDVKGAGVITHIWITIAPPPPDLSRNDIILRMYWDGSGAPSVNSPIGPFFGQGWNESYNYSSLPLAAGPREGRGLVCYFQMPFLKGAKIEIENQADRNIDAFYYYVDYVALDKLDQNAGRFHAWYNREITEADEDGENEWGTLGKQKDNPSGEKNYIIADIKGQGHYVGVNYYVNCPTPMWYGEGDDMIFIDGDQMPTLNGTGTEDYFNTSWSPNSLYGHPYYGYARVNNETGWLGRTHVYRFHVSDPLFFEESFKFTIEHGHANNLTLDLASVAYWYLGEAKPVPGIPPKEMRVPKPAIGPWQIHKWRHEWRESKGGDVKLWGDEE